MSAVLEFPELYATEGLTAEQTAESFAVAPASIAAVATIKGAVAKINAIEPELRALAERYRKVAYDLKTPKGLAECKAARHDLREHGRFAVQRAEKAVKDEVNGLKRDMGEAVERLIAIVAPEESRLHEMIAAREAEIAAERIEAQRKAAHEAGIKQIRAYVQMAQGMPSVRIAAGIFTLQQMGFPVDAWEEYAPAAEAARDEVVADLYSLQQAAIKRETEAVRVELQRQANERVAAENARVAAELARQQQEIEAARARVSARPRRAAAEVAIEAWLAEHAPGYPTYSMGKDGDDAWSFWIAPNDTTSYLHSDLSVQWAGTGWPESYRYDGDTGKWLDVEDARDAHADVSAAGPDTLWAVHVAGPDDIEAAASFEAAVERAKALNEWAKEKRLSEVEFVAGVLRWPFTAEAHAEDLRKTFGANTTGPEPEAQVAAPVGSLSSLRGLAAGALQGESSEAFVERRRSGWGGADAPARLADARDAVMAAAMSESMRTGVAVIAGDRVVGAADLYADPRDTLLAGALRLTEHCVSAFGGRFPSHPKPDQAWWSTLRHRLDTLQPKLIAAVELDARLQQVSTGSASRRSADNSQAHPASTMTA